MTTTDTISALMNPFAVTGEIGGHTIVMETGRLAQQAHGAVTITCGETILLATAVMSEQRREGIDFLPLTVEFEERLYAVGKIPGSFFRREGRPGTEAILSARLTDRSIRPLFPKGMHNEIQVIITVLSVDEEHPPETLGMVAASAALSISRIPFEGPIASCRVTWDGSGYSINSSYQQISASRLNMIVASNRGAIMMVESGSQDVSEEVILEGIRLAHESNVQTIELIDQMVAERGAEKLTVTYDAEATAARQNKVDALVNGRIAEVLERNAYKSERDSSLDAIEKDIAAQLADDLSAGEVAESFKNLVKSEVRSRILNKNVRPDGRKLDEIRPITCSVGELPRVHGSGLFTRGQTQVLSIATLASLSMRQTLDTVGPDNTKQFMHHYNFPPYSVGEARRVGSPGRREIGHGALAERAIQAALPPEAEFPYTIRVVSEVLASNGSTSMGSVCGSSMALMDAGVPLKAPVAGIAMGLITDAADGQYAVLSDIQGIEDFLGDMDFKVAGTEEGINALQMDVKIDGLTQELLSEALEQARVGRLHILDRMSEAISEPRNQMSKYAPKLVRMQIPVEKIGALIGPGGRVIRAIQEETGCGIDVSDDGSVIISSSDQTMIELASSRVDGLTRDPEVGDIITGKITRTTNFGVFVELTPGGKDGLVRNEDLGDLADDVGMGQEITVMIREIDHMGRINLSRRALLGDDSPPPPRPERSNFGGDRDRDRGGDRGPRGGGGGDRGPRSGGGGGNRGGYGGTAETVIATHPPAVIETVAETVIATHRPAVIETVAETVIATHRPAVIETVAETVIATHRPAVIETVAETVIATHRPAVIETAAETVIATHPPAVETVAETVIATHPPAVIGTAAETVIATHPPAVIGTAAETVIATHPPAVETVAETVIATHPPAVETVAAMAAAAVETVADLVAAAVETVADLVAAAAETVADLAAVATEIAAANVIATRFWGAIPTTVTGAGVVLRAGPLGAIPDEATPPTGGSWAAAEHGPRPSAPTFPNAASLPTERGFS